MNEELCSTVQAFYPIMPQKVLGDNNTEHFTLCYIYVRMANKMHTFSR